jgi:hypothetical protein
MNSSIFESTEISNNPAQSQALSREGVIYLKLINKTGLEVVVTDRRAGVWRVPSNGDLTWFSYSNAPSDLQIKVSFNNAAPVTDFLTVLTTSVTYECNDL